MAILWGLPDWVWAVTGLIALASCVVIVQVLRLAFQSLQQLAQSATLSAQLIKDSISETQGELSRLQTARSIAAADTSGRIPSDVHLNVPVDSWGDW